MHTNVNFSPEDLKRLYWHSRRGMLELDLLLVQFAQNELAALDVQSLQMYRELLAEEDQDLFLWLMRREPAPSPRLQHIVNMILDSHAKADLNAG